MSERSAAAGARGPKLELEHNGRTFLMRPVLTDTVMLAVESKLYKRACVALHAQRDMMDASMYERKLDELAKRFADGEFAFESKQTMEHLQTQRGSALLLSCLLDCTEAETLELLTERPAELQSMLKTVMTLSMPKGKATARRRLPRP